MSSYEVTVSEKLSELKQYILTIGSISFARIEQETVRFELLHLADCLINDEWYKYDDVSKHWFRNSLSIVNSWLNFLYLAKDYLVIPELDIIAHDILNDWGVINDHKVLIFSKGTCYNNYHQPSTLMTQVFKFWKDAYDIQLSYQPIFISIPENHKDSLLACLPVFHELGHCVITEYDLLSDVCSRMFDEKSVNLFDTVISDYLPSVYGKTVVSLSCEDKSKAVEFIEEYLADIFAAQYCGTHVMVFASYLFAGNYEAEVHHPSYNRRLLMVESFLSSYNKGRSSDLLLDLFVNRFEKIRKMRNPEIEGVRDDNTKTTYHINTKDDVYAMFRILWNIILIERDRMNLPVKSAVDYIGLITLPTFRNCDEKMRKLILAMN